MSLVGASSTSLNVTEPDGTPNVYGVSTIKFPNGTVTDNGDGSVTVSSGGSTAPGGSNRHVQFNDNGSFGGNSGFSYDSTGVVSLDAGGATDTILKLLGSTNYSIKSNTSDELVFHDATAVDDRLKIGSTGDLHILNDDAQLYFGEGSDAAIWYDGTDLNIDAAVIGSGVLASSTDITVPDEAYGVGWDSSLEVPTKNAVYDKIEALSVGGESNTASNVGTAGTGIFKQKTGVDLELYKLNSTSSLLAIALDGTDKIDFTVDNDLSNYSNATSAFITASSADTLTNKSGDISQWTNDSGYITATLTQEQVEDYAGALMSAGTGTHTGITVTYQDATGDMDFVVDHNAATNYVANEHIDWTTDQGATNIDAANITGLTIGTEVTGASTALSDTADITYNADTDVSGNGWVLDEDDLSSDSATKVPTQQSVKAYVDAVASGLDVKDSVRVATTAAGTLATDFENGDTIDGVVLATNDRILIKDQSSGPENGIYTVNASGAPTRATDFDTDAEVTAGAFTFVAEGTTNADSGWVLTTNDPIVVDTTALVFAQFSGAGQITAGEGLIKTGNTLGLRFSELTEDSAPATGDWFCFYDSTAGEHKKIDQNDLLTAIGGRAIDAVELVNDESVSSVDTIKFKAQADLTTPAALNLVDEGSGNVRLDGVGDVAYSGGVSVADHSIVRFDNTTGYLIQSGTNAPTYDDSGAVTIGSGGLSVTGLTNAIGGISTALDTDLGSTTIGTKSGGGWVTGKDTNDDLWIEGNGTGQVRQSDTLFSDVIAFEGALNSGLRLANIASGLESGITNMAEGSLYYQTDTDVLRAYNGSAWFTIGTPAELNDVGDVTITSATSGDMIRWSGSAWVNVQPVLSHITDVTATNSEVDYLAGSSVTNGHVVYADGTNFTGEDAFTFTTAGNTLQVGTTGEAGDIWAHGALQVGLITKVQLIESSGEMQVRNNADTDYADLRCESFYSEGGTFEVKATTVNFDTDTIVLNDDEAGVPSADVGIEVERGTSTNSALYWDESADVWTAGVIGSEHPLIYDADLLTEFTGVASGDKWVYWDTSAAEFRKIDNDDVLSVIGGGGRSGADAGELVYTVSGGGTESEAALTWDPTNDRLFVGIPTDIGGALNVFPAVVGDDIIFGRSIASYTGNYLRFEDNGGTAVFNLDKDLKLSVNQASNTLGQVEITADSDTMDAAGHDHAVPLWAHADYAQGQIVLDGQAAGSDLAYTVQETNDVDNSSVIWLGSFKNGTYGPTGTSGIISAKNGTGTTRDLILLSNDSAFATPQVTIEANTEFVGINNASPAAGLDIVTSSGSVPFYAKQNAATSTDPTLATFYTSTGWVGQFFATDGTGEDSFGIGTNTSHGLGLYVNNATTNPDIYIKSDGNVGIQNSSPVAALDVTGTGAFSGDVTVPDEAYGAGWSGSLEVPTKKDIYDKIEAISVGGISNIIEDTTPQLGGDLDTNGFNISFDHHNGITDDSGNELLMFHKNTSAVNYLEIGNSVTGSSPILYSYGSDTNVGLAFQSKGAGAYEFLGWSGSQATVKLFEDTANGTNSIGLTTAASLASDYTLTLPSATDTLVGRDTTDTFTNKSGNISQWTNDSGYITATLSQEQVEDYAGELISNATGTHTGITITYQDATGDMDFVVDHDAAANFDANEHFTQANITTVGTVTTGNVDAVVSAASTTTAGKVELATAAETDTGTDATRALTPDGFQDSKRNIRWLTFNLVEKDTDCAAATNIAGDFVSPIAGTILQSDSSPFYLYATNSTAGTTGTMVVDISIGGTSIMTTNKLDFDSAEKTTTTATTKPDLTTTSLSVGDIITIDIDSVHTTAAKGLTVYMAVRES